MLLGVRDRALLLLGFARALRRSETDQDGVGAVVDVPLGYQDGLYPVRAMHAWRATLAATLGVDENAVTGALCRPVDRHGRLGATRTDNAASR